MVIIIEQCIQAEHVGRVTSKLYHVQVSTLKLIWIYHFIHRAPYRESVGGGLKKQAGGQGHCTAIPAGSIVILSAPLDSQILITPVTQSICPQSMY